MQTIAERIDSALQGITQAATSVHRPPNSVKLLAVSKTKPVSDIIEAYEAGQRMFAENYVQEGVEKVQELAHLTDIEWHMIGPIQSNKTKVVSEHFDWVQSVDREKIARRLNEQRPDNLPPLNVCIQLNIDDEESKSGVKPDQLDSLIQFIKSQEKLCLRGIMAIPKANPSDEEQQSTLGKLKELYDHYHKSLANFDTLSVGMSSDMHAAIKNGSTMVRIGTAIFGKRG
ncbi:MAG: YggS family pyridoxal phosphate-dependent enzyme [Alteromonas sp.]|jgi:pyridoxal phosphate enzyme (YggS family)|uniref:YggS family pyridoxal phosphate-dependent enzyme n=1 Tax=unclassified Alteromonas TaxID=2614992 RepID=UPI0009033309|nr:MULTISPECIES: YggS family pyridoxal phosphate-dependent enzyme [unclassified Alteromonas]APE06771.1 YggS family pyridoxal phosphate enzyme [Alteromonas sp. RW2A1]AUC89297.1 YggS family pyridoxal phosphate-dependent enzyme [Alteromonas sp. MB-3u-76]MAI64844.1 YggS family pyridoxal phosphate-dependent enzyme [Alteromonas sp.]